MLLAELVATSDEVAATSKRLQKLGLLSGLLRAAGPHEVAITVSWLSGYPRQGRIGLGWAAVRDASGEPAPEPTLTLREVDTTFEQIARISGAGSTRERARLLRDVFARATETEQQFLARLILGELRHGALEGIMVDAVARAADIPLADVRRAHLFTGDLATVAEAAFTGGRAALSQFGIELFRPLKPMLAGTADDVDDALQQLGRGAFEFKLDGARVQVHRSGDDVRVYTRNLNEVTESVPELVEAVRTLPGRELVLDGEAIALNEDGRPLPFQTTMKRFGRKLDVRAMREMMPLRPFFFDLLYLDGETLIDLPATDRFDALTQAAPPELLVPRRVIESIDDAREFLEQARLAGHEGLVAKSLDAAYDAGRRGSAWLKLKFTETLDLVILAAEWGHGRRQGWLSNLHLGARDPEHGGFVMLGKTFKGLTDQMLEWQTRELLAREIARDAYTVHVRPELVAEVAFDDVQTSPRYPAGLALRFARIKRFRPDKRAEDADTIGRVREIFAGLRSR